MSSARSDSARTERSTGKGRRRRAAQQQRRIEQERWRVDEEDIVLLPPVQQSQRRNNRRARREEERHNLEVAIALSLSLADDEFFGRNDPNSGVEAQGGGDMTYETLVELEDVKVVAPVDVVSSLDRTSFQEGSSSCFTSCVICMEEYVQGDTVVHLACKHHVHEACGLEWLSKYSKYCPVCKHEVSKQTSGN